jgi:Tfp pilus assembly protein PilN
MSPPAWPCERCIQPERLHCYGEKFAMKDIDFLPIRYRERTALRRARVWRFVMLGCLAGFVAIVSLAQLAIRRPVERQLATVAALYPTAVMVTAQADQLQKDLNDLESFATLYTYLRHPWPVSQMLRALTDSLPESIVLTEVTLDRQPTASLSAAPPAGQPVTPPATPAEAAKRDLDRLRNSQDSLTPTLHVTGIAADARKLNAYVTSLASSSLFVTARLESLEAVTSPTGISGSRFEVRLQLRPGFGQPQGPTEPLRETNPAVAVRATRDTEKP